MFLNLFRRRTVNHNQLFNGQYIDAKGLFLHYFDRPPNISYITQVDVNAAYPFLRRRLKSIITDTFQHAQYNYERGVPEFNVLFLVIEHVGIIEIGSDYISLLHGMDQADWANSLLKELAQFRIVENQTSKIGFVTQSAN